MYSGSLHPLCVWRSQHVYVESSDPDYYIYYY